MKPGSAVSVRTRPSPVTYAAWTFHSFVFAVLPAAAFLIANMRRLPIGLGDAARSAGFLMICNLALLATLSPLLGIRSAAATLSWFFIALSFYPSAVSVLDPVALLSEAVRAVWYVAGCALMAAWLGRPVRGHDVRYRILNVAAGTLLVVCAALMVIETPRGASRTWSGGVDAIVQAAPAVEWREGKPDIYYIILDGLGRADILERAYGVDAAGPVNALTRLGWRIVPGSHANYTQTYLSIASALNGSYLDPLAQQMRGSSDRRPLFELIQRSGVIAGLKRIGYTFFMIGSNTSVTASHRQADTCMCDWPGLTEFENSLLSLSPFGQLPLRGPTHRSHYTTILTSFDLLETPPPSDRPLFVFAHIMAPHPPFEVDRHGASTSGTGPVLLADANHFHGSVRQYRDGYREQTTFVLNRLVRLAEAFEARRRPAIVVVHGDHGPGARFNHSHFTTQGAAERFPIFMALRIPEPAPPIPDDLSPVNVFRFIFSIQSRSQIEWLENRTYYSTWDLPYDLVPVTISEIEPKQVAPEESSRGADVR